MRDAGRIRAGASAGGGDAPTLCRPFTSSYFAVEHAIAANGIHADIRRFGWDRPSEASFKANGYYIDYSLVPRSPNARLFFRDRRHAPPPGRSVFLPNGVELTARNEPCESQLLCLTFDDRRAPALFERDADTLDPCFDVRAPRVEQALRRLAEEVRAPGFGHDVLIESLALVLAVELCRHLRDRDAMAAERGGGLAPWRLKRLRERIEDGLRGQVSVGELAAECRISPRHLARTFRNSTGMTLSAYIAQVRMRRACARLVERDAMIKAIAHECGFRNAAAFSSAFQKAVGVTPKEFRQRAMLG